MVTKPGASDEKDVNESIDAETLAAFLDGTLSAGARAGVLRKLAANRDDFETFSEVRALLDGVEDQEPAWGNRAAANSAVRAGRRRWLVVPAALAIAATAALLLRQPHADPLEQLKVTALFSAPGTAVFSDSMWVEPGWTTTRGTAAASSNDVRAFRLGARAAAAELAAGTDDVDAYQAALARAERESRTSTLGGPVAAAILEMLATEAIAPASERAALWSELRLIDGGGAYFDLGACVESARIAQLDANARFFETESPLHEGCRQAAAQVRREGGEPWTAVSSRAVDLYTVRPAGQDGMDEVAMTLRALMSALPR